MFLLHKNCYTIPKFKLRVQDIISYTYKCIQVAWTYGITNVITKYKDTNNKI